MPKYATIDGKPIKNTLDKWALFINPNTERPQIRGIAQSDQPDIGLKAGEVLVTSAVLLIDTNLEGFGRYCETLNSIYLLAD